MADINMTNPVFNRKFPQQEYWKIRDFYFKLLESKSARKTVWNCLKIQNVITDIQNNPDNFWSYWKAFYIPKKDGSQRVVYQPSDILQRFFHIYLILVQTIDETEEYLIEHKIIDNDFRNLYDSELLVRKCLHDSFLLSHSYNIVGYTSKKQNSYGFEKGKNISMNATRHKDSQYFLKMDIQAAFPSIKKQSIFKILYFYERKLESLLVILKTLIYRCSISDFIQDIEKTKNKNKSYRYTKRMCNGLSEIITLNNCLITGASLSPWILNKYLYKFDVNIQKYCQKRNLIYTRYADDLTISSNCKISRNTHLFIKHMLKNWGMNENTKKTCFQSHKRKNVITGIVVSYDDKTKKGSLGIGYKRFNELKKNLYLMKQNKLTEKEEQQTLGMLNFLSSVNIDRYNYLVEKYELYGF